MASHLCITCQIQSAVKRGREVGLSHLCSVFDHVSGAILYQLQYTANEILFNRLSQW